MATYLSKPVFRSGLLSQQQAVIAAALLYVAAFVGNIVYLAPLEQRNAALTRQLQESRSQQNTSQAAQVGDMQTPSPVLDLPTHATSDRDLSTMASMLRTEGVQIERIAFDGSKKANSTSIESTRIHITAKSTYVKLRQALRAISKKFPSLTLTELQIERASAQDALPTKSTIVLTYYYQALATRPNDAR